MRYSYEFKIGMTVLLFIVILLVTMGTLGYWRLSRPRGITVRVYFDRTTSGITRGTNVYLGGAPVGWVRENKFDPDRNLPYLTVEIMKGQPVAKDSLFTIEQESFFGEPRVYITQGNTGKGVLTSGGVADNLGTTKPTFTDLVADLDYQLRDVSISVQSALASAQSLIMQAQHTLLTLEPEIKATISELPELLDDVRSDLNRVTEQVNRTLGVVEAAGTDTRLTIQDIRHRINQIFERVDQSLTQLHKSLIEVTEMIASPENRKTVEEILTNIQQVSENLRKLSETLGNEETREAIRETLQNTRQATTTASRIARGIQGLEVEAKARAYALQRHPQTEKVELGEQIQAIVTQNQRNWFASIGQERVGSHGNGMWYFGYRAGPSFRLGIGTRRGAPSAQMKLQNKGAFIEASGWWRSQSPQIRYQLFGGVRAGRLELFSGLEREDTEDPLALFGLGFAF